MMTADNVKALAIGGVSLVGVFVAWKAYSKVSAMGGGVVEAIAAAPAVAVETIGQVIGIPTTNQTQCEADLAAGNIGAASFSCPAGAFVTGAPVAAVEGIGQVVGVPKTNRTQCEADIAAGRTWDASFSCSAGTFLGSLFASKPGNADTGNGYDSNGDRAGVRYDSNGNVIGVY